MNGDFSFDGLGQPIYDPKSHYLRAGRRVAPTEPATSSTHFPAMSSPKAASTRRPYKFLSLNPYNTPNLTPTFTTTGPTNDYLSGTIYLSDRQAYLGKIDQTINDKQKLFVRYIWNKYRVIGSRNNVLFNWRAIDNTALGFGLPEPIDERNIAFGLHLYPEPHADQRTSDRLPAPQRHHHPVTANQGWAGNSGNSGRRAADLPGLDRVRQQFRHMDGQPRAAVRARINEDITLADNVTKVRGTAYVKFGLPGNPAARERYLGVQPSGVYVSVPTVQADMRLLPNTGNSLAYSRTRRRVFGDLHHAARELSAALVSESVLRAGRLENPPQPHVSFGLRYSVESPARDAVRPQVELQPNHGRFADRSYGRPYPSEGRCPAYTDLHNFTPRLGVAWNFRPHFVFRGLLRDVHAGSGAESAAG